MRTYEEIVARVQEVEYRDFFNWERVDLISFLPFGYAKPFLKPEIDKKEWKPHRYDRKNLLEIMLDYMPFAWEKANEKRGISAGRSMSHYSAWTWLAGDDLGDLTEYEYYGKDNLVRICKHYGWDCSQWDDGIRENE